MAEQHAATGGHHGKDVSVGEYEPATGLTHVTRQRGRLLFNMGTSTAKRQRRAPSKSASPAAASSSSAPRPAEHEPVLMRTGRFTGLSLYPEEAFYLLQRGALAVYLLLPRCSAEQPPLSVAAFASMLATDTRVSPVCLEVYSFLKGQKLHPRRCLERVDSATDRFRRREPQHFAGGDAWHVAFDVWKTVVTHVEAPSSSSTPGADAAELTPSNAQPTRKHAQRQSKSKRLALAFRVLVSRYGDVAPRPRVLRQALERGQARASDEQDATLVAVKLAVVHQDRSVLLFELGGTSN